MHRNSKQSAAYLAHSQSESDMARKYNMYDGGRGEYPSNNYEDEGESEYMDMRVNKPTSPAVKKRSGSGTSVYSPIHNRTPQLKLPSHEPESDYVEVTPSMTRNSFNQGRQPVTPKHRSNTTYTTSPFNDEDTDYADMTGTPKRQGFTRNDYLYKSVRTPTRTTNKYDVSKHPSSPSTLCKLKSTGDLSRNFKSRSPSPRHPETKGIREGGFNKDDEDDYHDVVHPVGSAYERSTPVRQTMTLGRTSHKRPSTLNTKMRQDTFITPPATSGWFGSLGNASDDSNSDFSDYENVDVKDTRRSPGIQHNSLTSTEAGRAARKYLMRGDKLSPSYTGNGRELGRFQGNNIIRSTSRAGKAGAVQSRISKSKQSKTSDGPQDSPEASPVSTQTKPNVLHRTQSTSSSDRPDIELSRRKSRTLDKEMQHSLKMMIETEFLSATPQLESEKRLSAVLPKAASPVTKLSPRNGQSHTLDKNYIAWLAKTSPFASRHQSVSSSNIQIDSPSNRSMSLSSNDQELDNERLKHSIPHNDDDQGIFSPEAFSDSHVPSVNSKFVSLSRYADSHFKTRTDDYEEIPQPKKVTKPPHAKVQHSKSFSGKRQHLERVDFTDAAEAFHMEYVTKQNKHSGKTKSSTDISEKNKVLRKSFRFANKKKSKSSTSSPMRQQVETTNHQEPVNIKSSTDALDVTDSVNYGITRSRASSASSPRRKSNIDLNASPGNYVRAASETKIKVSGSGSVRSRSSGILAGFDQESTGSPSREKKSISRAGTLGRLFSRKGKERRALDSVDFSGNLAVLPTRKYHTLSRRNDKLSLSSIPSDLIHSDAAESRTVLDGLQLTKGISVFDNQAREAKDSYTESRKTSAQLTVGNKYATLSALPRKQHSHQHSDASSDMSTEPSLQKHKRSRSSLRGFSFTRNGELPNKDTRERIKPTTPTINNDVVSNKLSLLQAQRQKIQMLHTEIHNDALAAARIVYSYLIQTKPDIITEHKSDEEISGLTDDNVVTYRNCCFGHELVAWLCSYIKTTKLAVISELSRFHVNGLWQVLLEEGLVYHVRHEQYFEDTRYLYQFHNEVAEYAQTAEEEIPEKSKLLEVTEDKMVWVLAYLNQNSPDAMLRTALRKLYKMTSNHEMKVLAQLSDLTTPPIVFHQGDEGRSWYIISKGSVDVVIQGKGVVCSLHEGDDFGNLAIVNDVPRAATIVTTKPNCQFLRVDKYDFNKIHEDVESKTVRLKEHGNDVLILQKSSKSKEEGTSTYVGSRGQKRYNISAGTAEKIVNHILESLQPWVKTRHEENLEDFLLTFRFFTTTQKLCDLLLQRYNSEVVNGVECSRSLKKRVVYLVVRWSYIATHLFIQDLVVQHFLQVLRENIAKDIQKNLAYLELQSDLNLLYKSPENDDVGNVVLTVGETIQRYPSPTNHDIQHAIHDNDEVLLKIYDLQSSYTTVKVPICLTCEETVNAACEKINRSPTKMLLFELQENNDIHAIPKHQMSVATSTKLNSRLYMCGPDERDELATIQLPPPTNQPTTCMETVSSLEVAYHVTQHDWQLMNNIHPMEFLFKTFGAHKFHHSTANLDVLSRRFNQLAYWPPTEICLCHNISKRVQLLRKFIKVAENLKMYGNMFGFMAVMIGIGNQAISRLHGTWDKLPTKYRKLVQEFETILDPSRNHRNYRVFVSSTNSARIPYFPLIMKDLTFQHEGNDTFNKNGLVNFEKMHMLSNSIRLVVQGCSRNLGNFVYYVLYINYCIQYPLVSHT
ncbi:uncharacterized protein LOC100186896 [Ciona intestinalis]